MYVIELNEKTLFSVSEFVGLYNVVMLIQEVSYVSCGNN